MKRFGWFIALLGVLLLLLFAILVTINRSSKELPTAIQSNKLVDEVEVGKSKGEITNAPASSIKKSTKTNKIEIKSSPSEIKAKDEITAKDDIKALKKKFPSPSLESSFKEDSLSDADLVKPSLIEQSAKIGQVDSVLPSEVSSNTNKLLPIETRKEVVVEIDIMRVDSQGEALIAGRTKPNTAVEVLADGFLVGSAQADSQGEFVIMGTLVESIESQTLTVRSSVTPAIEKEIEKEPALSSSVVSDNYDIIESNEYSEWTLSDDIFVVLPSLTDSKTNEGLNLNSVPVIVQSSSTDIKIIQNAEQTFVAGITIDSISYSEFGEAILVGRGNPNNKVLVYLNNALTKSSKVGALGGWSTELTGILPGIYKLRIDEVNAAGKVQSRIATPFKKESKDFLMNMVSGSITVQTGNSLWRIARRIFGQGIRYIEIYEKNNSLIKDPNLIYPGQVFSIPVETYDS